MRNQAGTIMVILFAVALIWVGLNKNFNLAFNKFGYDRGFRGVGSSRSFGSSNTTNGNGANKPPTTGGGGSFKGTGNNRSF